MTLPDNTTAFPPALQTQIPRKRSLVHLLAPLEAEASLGRHLVLVPRTVPKRNTSVMSNLEAFSRRC